MTAIDELIGEGLGTTPDDSGPDAKLFVCHLTNDDGEICGDGFSDRRRLSTHTMAKHKVTLDGKPVMRNPRKKAADKEPSKTKTKSAPKAAADAARAPITDRSTTYATSIATYAMVGHLAAGRFFDRYDLMVVTNGAPGLGAALDQVGQENEAFQRGCDLILAGGTGGAYVGLFMATAMIAVPLLAHHGILPEEIGGRFAELLGAAAPVAKAPEPEVTDTPTAPATTRPVEEWDIADWQQALVRMPPNVAVDLAASMMGSDGEIGVSIPTMPGTEPLIDIPQEDHRGSLGADIAGTETESVSPS